MGQSNAVLQFNNLRTLKIKYALVLLMAVLIGYGLFLFGKKVYFNTRIRHLESSFETNYYSGQRKQAYTDVCELIKLQPDSIKWYYKRLEIRDVGGVDYKEEYRR